MISAYSVLNGSLRKLDCSDTEVGLADATWIDLLEPTKEQERTVEAILGIDIPSREEMQSLEASSQTYRDDDALVMTARVLSKSGTAAVRLVSVTFVLRGGTLATMRYGDPMPFRTFVARAEKEASRMASGWAVMVGLLEAIVGRAAEILQAVGDDLETLSTEVFNPGGASPKGSARVDLQPVIQRIGRNGDLAARVRESLHSLDRIVPFLRADGQDEAANGLAERLDTVARDIASLLDHDTYLAANVTFLLDATLGLINIQQNATIKVFSVAAMIFLPPTLIASIYGMNFEHMPELKWSLGYPYVLLLMLASAVVPYFYFKRRGWL